MEVSPSIDGEICFFVGRNDYLFKDFLDIDAQMQ